MGVAEREYADCDDDDECGSGRRSSGDGYSGGGGEEGGCWCGDGVGCCGGGYGVALMDYGSRSDEGWKERGIEEQGEDENENCKEVRSGRGDSNDIPAYV